LFPPLSLNYLIGKFGVFHIFKSGHNTKIRFINDVNIYLHNRNEVDNKKWKVRR